MRSKCEAKKRIAFQCPEPLLSRIDERAKAMRMSRKDFMILALGAFATVVRRRGGHITPPASAHVASLEIAHFKALMEAKLEQR